MTSTTHARIAVDEIQDRDAFAENYDGSTHEYGPCLVCGRTIKGSARSAHFVTVADTGDGDFVVTREEGRELEEQGYGVWDYAIGSGCWKQVKDRLAPFA